MRGMRRVNNDYIKEGDSKRIAEDVERFLADGGKINYVKFGIYAEKRVSLTQRQVLIGNQKDPNKAARR